uniref:Uncharacterized protein n=1 Tax=viral metagenome TaxID=1070528 RepID=A0A6M3J9U9_9ZZZZ
MTDYIITIKDRFSNKIIVMPATEEDLKGDPLAPLRPRFKISEIEQYDRIKEA